MRAGAQSERLATWRGPASFTVLIPTEGESVSAVTDRLRTLAPRIEAVGAKVEALHTLRMCVAPAERQPKCNSNCVLLNLVYDPPLDAPLQQLTEVAGPLLAEALRYDGPPESLASWLMSFRRRDQTVYIAAIGTTVRQIRSDLRVREALQDWIDLQIAEGSVESAKMEDLRQRARTFLQSELPGALNPTPTLSAGGRWNRLWDRVGMFIFPAIGVLSADITGAIRRIESTWRRRLTWVGYLLWWFYGGIPTVLVMLFVRLVEGVERDRSSVDVDEARVAPLEARENISSKNPVTLWLPVKPTIIRRVLLWLVLWGSEKGARHLWTDGRLTGIDTIHHARILQVDGGRTMIFMSDYDGALNRYLDDFLTVGRRAILSVSGQVEGCPRTHWLFRPADAAWFGPRFRALIRRHQLELLVWYHAYPEVTAGEVLANAALREGLSAPSLSEADARAWVRRL